MSHARHIFIVDDDPDIRSLTSRLLVREGFKVTAIGDADAMDARLERVRPDLILLDVMLPGRWGTLACRALRSRGDDVPVILLTALGEVEHRVEGLTDGADDYLAKPFDSRELILRINAVLRRRAQTPSAPQAFATLTQVGAATLDPGRRTLQRDDEAIALTDGEFALLRAFLRHPYTPLTRARLAELARADGTQINDRSIDVAVHRLRRLVEAVPAAPTIVQTVRGIGYVYAPQA